MTKPSWWSFKGDASKDPAKLAAAPKFEGDTRKPSETSKPYPTTSTPNGYVITGTGAAGAAVAAIQPPSPQQPVVYGQTPPPALAAAEPSPAPPPVSAAGGPRAAPQVGPYAALAGDQIPPAGQPLPNIGPVSSGQMAPAAAPATATAGYPTDRSAALGGQPGESPLPSTAFPATPQPAGGDGPAARVADARGIPEPRAAEAAAFAGAGAEMTGARYAGAGSSRFGDAAPAAAFPAAAAPGGFGRPPETLAPGPSAVTPPNVPVAAPAATPALLPSSGQPVAPPADAPMRRPDPVYRPFGTSSYRPTQQILAGDLPGPGPVRTASYEDPAVGPR